MKLSAKDQTNPRPTMLEVKAKVKMEMTEVEVKPKVKMETVEIGAILAIIKYFSDPPIPSKNAQAFNWLYEIPTATAILLVLIGDKLVVFAGLLSALKSFGKFSKQIRHCGSPFELNLLVKGGYVLAGAAAAVQIAFTGYRRSDNIIYAVVIGCVAVVTAFMTPVLLTFLARSVKARIS
ncbi:hypothetical protein AX16_007460 [Volvariella volvacea WC 439]|nr:hypothetical protein AX16_007460 [Volvariella volvacea WC 439]